MTASIVVGEIPEQYVSSHLPFAERHRDAPKEPSYEPVAPVVMADVPNTINLHADPMMGAATPATMTSCAEAGASTARACDETESARDRRRGDRTDARQGGGRWKASQRVWVC